MRGIGSSHWPGRQRGLALLVLLVLFATAASYMLVSSLNRGSVALSLTRAEKNRAVMQQAKDALLAYAASETLQGGSASFRPGRLPCPDRTNVDGSAAGSCAGVNLLGRLPYKTLGIEELRDASGERLWYAVSNNFKTGAGVINADTRGAITVSGLAPATNAVAVLFSPGTRLGSQDRSAAGMNSATNYLEGVNSDTNYDQYIAAAENVNDTVVANLFNDQLLVVTEQDLFTAVEPVVAARIQRDIVMQYIYNPSPGTSTNWTDGGGTDRSRYFDAWGGFPFAAPFASPGSSSFTGQASTYEGLLPMADLSPNPVSSPYYRWNSGSVTQTGGSGVVWNGSNCSTTNSSSRVQCGIWYYYAPTFRISGIVDKVGRSFVQLPKLADVSISGASMSSRSISGSLTGSGAGVVNLDATMSWQSGWTYATVIIKNDNMIASQLISTGDPYAGWFNSDQWYKQVYYAVSTGYAGASGSCTPGTNCLTVNNLNAAATNDKRAILILAGRSLAGASRPNASIGDYLEAKNDPTLTNISTGDYVFEHGLRRTSTASTAINDKVIVIAP